MDLMLKGKVAIVGGASKASAARARRRWRKKWTSRSAAARKPISRKPRRRSAPGAGVDVLAYPGDLDQHDTIRGLIATTVQRFGRLDILVNNSAVRRSRMHEMPTKSCGRPPSSARCSSSHGCRAKRCRI